MSLGGASLTSGISSLTMNSVISHGASLSEPVALPPPLPPRRKRESSSGCELSPIRTVAPALPAKAAAAAKNDALPPPIPPRGNRERGGSVGYDQFISFHHHHHHLIEQGNMTLPRQRTQYHPGALSTLPRRNSERDYLSNQPQFVNVNGDRGGSVTPELPPKTYRSIVHSRQQSS